VWQKPNDFFKIAIPGALFTIQNNLTFVALSFMDAASFQVMSQLKILTTAVMSILMLHKKLDRFKWISLFLLMTGVSIIEVRF
jgi:UDP-galactose transporter